MHNEFKDLLEDAEGISEKVIAVNLDIRSFSEFCKQVDTSEITTYITSVYNKLINDYFDYATFFKSTGDGLFIIITYDKDNLYAVAQKTMKSCLDVVNDFSKLHENDPHINFDVPENIGIGISRGAASRIESNKKILDYSGRILNLASRLMDVARPSGIVIDANFIMDILTDEQKELFDKDFVYLKGIAERKAVGIYYTKEFTSIPPSNKLPFDKIRWKTVQRNSSITKIRKEPLDIGVKLPSIPIDTSKIKVKFIFRHSKKEEANEYSLKCEYTEEGNEARVLIQHNDLIKAIESAEKAFKLNNAWKSTIKVIYPEKWIPAGSAD